MANPPSAPRIILEKLRAAELPVSRVVVVDLRTAEPVIACALVVNTCKHHVYCWFRVQINGGKQIVKPYVGLE